MKIPMKALFPIWVSVLLVSAPAQSSFFDDLRNAVEKSAKDTATDMAADMAEDLVRNMFVGYSTQQTKTDKQVSKEYTKEYGSLPAKTKATSYSTKMVPGSAVSPGTKVVIQSSIEVVPGRDGERASIEEELTIYDNEDNSLALKSMTKQAQRSAKGGEFEGEFTFTLPEDMPQGVYPIRLVLLLNGEIAGDSDHELQLVMRVDKHGAGQLYAAQSMTAFH